MPDNPPDSIYPKTRAEWRAWLAAQKNFEGFPRSAKLVILQWVASAKTPETRARGIEETAHLAEQNLCANQWRPKKAVLP